MISYFEYYAHNDMYLIVLTNGEHIWMYPESAHVYLGVIQCS